MANFPILIECDRHGQVVWVSERMRALLGEPRDLSAILNAKRRGRKIPFRIFQLLADADRVVLAAEMDAPVDCREARQAACLRHLEIRLLQSYFRLQAIERQLASRVRRRSRPRGGATLRQIEVERKRIASELHTGVGQMLAAIRLQLEIIASQINDPPAAVGEALENIGALAAGALDQVRSVSRRLHPPEWQRLTLTDALRQLWDLSGIPQKFQAELHIEALDREPDPEVKMLVYRTAQEGVSNVTRHSNANWASLSLVSEGGVLTLAVEDNGIGFDTSAVMHGPLNMATGIGLRSLTEQAESAGAKIDVESGGNGTKLVLTTRYSLGT